MEISYINSNDASKFNVAFCLFKESMNRLRMIEFEMASGSMSPFLKVSDKLTVGNIAAKDLKLGDIAVYRMGEILCAHRYIYTLKREGSPSMLVTKADSLSDLDSYLVPIDLLLGKVTLVKRQAALINLEGFFYRKINYLIGFISFLQTLVIKILCHIKYALFGHKSLPFFKQIAVFPFSSVIKSITILAFRLRSSKVYAKRGKTDLSPEEKLAVLCARVGIDGRTRLQIEELLSRGIDWKRLNNLLSYHHVSVLVYYNIRKICSEAIPIELSVKEKIDECIAKNIFLSRELKAILSSLKEAGLDAISMKGIYLLNNIYADLPLREMHDIDILIQKKDLSAADESVRESGYQPYDQTFYGRDPGALKNYRKFFYHLRYKKTSANLSAPIFLEIHFDILPPFRGRSAFLSDIWKNSRNVSFSGISFSTMSTEDLLIYLSLKLFASFEFFIILKDLCDIAELIKLHHRQIDWNALIEKAKIYNAASMLYYSLRLTKDILMDGNSLIPKNVIDELKPFFLKRIFIDRIIIRDGLSEEADNGIPLTAFAREYLFDVMSLRNILDMWRLARNILYGRDFYERLLKMPKYKRGFLYLSRFLGAPVLLMGLAIRSLRRNFQ